MLTRSTLAKAAAVAAAIILVSASPARAVNYTAYEGSDYASINPADRNWIQVCDMERDGNGVYGQFKTGIYDGYKTYTYWDSNGSAAGCFNTYISGHRGIYEMRVCEDDAGADTCSPWKPVQPV